MRCSDFTRREYAPRCSITHSCQILDDVGQPHRDMSLDVFKETDIWSHCSNSICNERPKVPGVFFPKSLSCCAEWLAWVAPREDIHLSTKLCEREGFKIRPNRCCVQESRFHFSDQVRAGETFDLRKSDCAKIWDCSAESNINASVSSAETNVCNCFGSIHVISSIG